MHVSFSNINDVFHSDTEFGSSVSAETNVNPDTDASFYNDEDADTNTDVDLDLYVDFKLIFLKAISVFLNFDSRWEKMRVKDCTIGHGNLYASKITVIKYNKLETKSSKQITIFVFEFMRILQYL